MPGTFAEHLGMEILTMSSSFSLEVLDLDEDSGPVQPYLHVENLL